MKTISEFLFIKYILMIGGLIFSVSIMAQNSASQNSIFDRMHYKEVLEINLEIDVESLQNDRRSEEYRKGVLTFKDKNKIEQTWNIKARPRGNFRRLLCEMTPLKLKWKKADLRAAGLADFNDLKLVTSCLENKWDAKNLLTKEYLAYRLYNELTPHSFRVQFVKINYKDINTGKKTRQWGFLIEDTAQLAARMDAEKIEGYGLPIDTFHSNAVKMVALFQYMIGNGDWSLQMQRNIKFFEKNGEVIPVPYDFDFSGLINAPYAIPNPDYGLKAVTERTFLGFEEHMTSLHSMRAYFRTKRSDLQRIIDRSPLIGAESSVRMEAYLSSYFFYEDKIKFQPRTVVLSD